MAAMAPARSRWMVALICVGLVAASQACGDYYDSHQEYCDYNHGCPSMVDPYAGDCHTPADCAAAGLASCVDEECSDSMCAADAQCRAGEVCRNRLCALACDPGGRCPVGFVCDATAGTCAAADPGCAGCAHGRCPAGCGTPCSLVGASTCPVGLVCLHTSGGNGSTAACAVEEAPTSPLASADAGAD